jgi:hypothetical protein
MAWYRDSFTSLRRENSRARNSRIDAGSLDTDTVVK